MLKDLPHHPSYESPQDSQDIKSFRGIVLDPDSPESLRFMVGTKFWERVVEIPKNFLEMDPREIEDRVKPGLVLEALRCAFWVEFNRAALEGYSRIILPRVYAGICTEAYFFNKVLVNPLLLTFLLTPPNEYVSGLNAMLTKSMRRIFEILELPIIDKKNKVDHRAAALILKAHEMIENRVRGSVVQRLESKQLNVNLNSELPDEASLDRKLKELREREKLLTGRGPQELTKEAGNNQETERD